MPGWNELEFEWDEEKAVLNCRKHGVSFYEAARVFDDLDRKEYYDAAHSGEEDRYNTIGLVDDILFVVYTERRETIRIISARHANQRERRMYYDD